MPAWLAVCETHPVLRMRYAVFRRHALSWTLYAKNLLAGRRATIDTKEGYAR